MNVFYVEKNLYRVNTTIHPLKATSIPQQFHFNFLLCDAQEMNLILNI